jgi:hypothetical protein
LEQNRTSFDNSEHGPVVMMRTANNIRLHSDATYVHSCSDFVVKGLSKESYSHNWFRHALILPAVDSLDWQPARSCPQAGPQARSQACLLLATVPVASRDTHVCPTRLNGR